MKKKSSHRKIKPFHLLHKKDSFSQYFSLLRLSFTVIAVAALVSLIYPQLIEKRIQCANSISCKEAPKLEVEENAIGIFNNKPIHAPNISLSQNEVKTDVLGTQSTQELKHIFVNLTSQTLTAYEGSTVFMKTPISSGLWGKTPLGDFTIWTKIRSTRMTGGSGDDFYDLPNVPYVMFFSNSEVPGSVGFSIHGTYWHNNFGHAMSHGCINMKTTDVAKLFAWAEAPIEGKKGTVITIYEESAQ